MKEVNYLQKFGFVATAFLFAQVAHGGSESDAEKVGSVSYACDHPIFCVGGPGSLLHTIQMSGLFNDSKTFVDLHFVTYFVPPEFSYFVFFTLIIISIV